MFLKLRRQQMSTMPSENMRIVARNFPTGTLLITPHEFIINKAAEEITGYCQADFQTIDDWFEKLYQERAPQFKAMYKDERRRGALSPLVEIKRKDGESRQILFEGYKTDVWSFWTMRDITEHLIDSEKFKILFENSSDGYAIFDGRGVIDCNPAALKLLGLNDKKDLVSLHPAMFSPEFQPDGEKSSDKSRRMDAMAMENGIHDFEWTHRRPDGGELTSLVTLIRVKLNGKDALFVIWHDLTEIKKNQALLSYKTKMSALGEMAAGLAHELNNPLAIIKGNVFVLRTCTLNKDPEFLNEVERPLRSIEGTVGRMAQIIRGLRDFSRESKGDEPFVPAALYSIVQETVSFCSERFRNHSIELNINLPDNLLVSCRSVEISQVLLNLLNNACDAIMKLENRWIAINAFQKEQEVIIHVSDSGNGICPNIVDKVMQPFFTTKGPHEGSGLGLSISKGIIEKHGGRISVLAGTQNTTFEIALPSVEGFPVVG